MSRETSTCANCGGDIYTLGGDWLHSRDGSLWCPARVAEPTRDADAPCFCIYDARTTEREPNPHCPRHRMSYFGSNVDGSGSHMESETP